MKEIKLSQWGKNRGKYITLVDDKDYEFLNQWKWFIKKGTNTFYVIRNNKINGKKKIIKMHRIIMNTPDYLQVDHIDHNGLNNQRSNLRNCTKSQNHMNKMPYGKSEYLGVYVEHRYTIIYVAQIFTNSKQIKLGRFKKEEDAARAYDKAALKYHGEFANLNFP